nr:hypothetical protein [Tanacetum cinerariifolium]
MALMAYADADHGGCQDTRRSASGSAQFQGDKLVSCTSGPSTLTFAIISFTSKLKEAWLNSTSCRRIINSRTYSPKHYHDSDTMTDVTAPTGQAPTMAPPVRSNDQSLPRIGWVQTGYLMFSAKGTKREVFGMPIPGSLITADLRQAL